MEKEIYKEEKQGTALKVFGVVLIILGSLNLMLCWRGGLSISPFYPVILLIGLGLFIIGKLKNSSESD